MSKKYEVKAIVDKRVVKKKIEYLVVWANTWEKASNLKDCKSLLKPFNQNNAIKSKAENKENDTQEDHNMSEEEEEDKPVVTHKKTDKRGKRGAKKEDKKRTFTPKTTTIANLRRM